MSLSPFSYRAKYFQGKKVNGEFEIRVEQVSEQWKFCHIFRHAVLNLQVSARRQLELRKLFRRQNPSDSILFSALVV